jgi:hypothetical protein
VNHAAFLAADPIGRERLLYQALHRSLDLIPALRVPGFDLARLRTDFERLGRERDWLTSAGPVG